MSVPGLRQRKKEQTREAIASAALDLFERKGFHATTIRDIAEAADVAPRTVSGYFPAKEQLVFDGYEELFTDLEQRLTARDAGTTTADALRAFLHEIAEPPKDAERVRRLRALVEAEPALRAFERAVQERAERIVADAAAVDLGVDADSLLPHMVGAATVAALDALGRHMKDGDDVDEGRRLIDDAMTFIGGGVRALRG
jgi:AcrR family transcriptional regulator